MRKSLFSILLESCISCLPVMNSGEISDPKNNGPGSLLSVIRKVFESITNLKNSDLLILQIIFIFL